MTTKINRDVAKTTAKAKPKSKRVPKGVVFFDDVAQIIEKARKFVGRTADLTLKFERLIFSPQNSFGQTL